MIIAIVSYGCSAALVPYSSDPDTKLEQAVSLLEGYEPLHRPLPAERLIWDSIEICRNEGDEPGLARAYGAYAFFLYSAAVGNWEKHYREEGFRDESVTFDNRKEKSVEYHKMAKNVCMSISSYDCVANAYLNIGSIYHYENRPEEACAAFHECSDNFLKFREVHPDQEVQLPAGYGSFEEYLDAVREEADCEST
jgi:hypothetical protein